MSDSRKGPNRVKPAKNIFTSDRNGVVNIPLGDDEITGHDPISVPCLMNRTVRDYPDHPALVFQNDKHEWEQITFSQYRDRAYKMAKVFLKLGLEHRNSVAILAFNSPEWFVSFMAAIHAGGMACGVYTTNSADATKYVLESSKANIVVVDDSKQMDKIRAKRAELPHLKAIIQTNGPFGDYMKEEDGYYKWSDLMAMNVDDQNDEFQKRMEQICINEACALVYTSGTVGTPKGVMVSHDSFTWDSWVIAKRLENVEHGREVIVSYLPLSHVAALMVDIFLSLTYSATVYFGDKDALKGTLVKTLLVARPTRFLGVPRVFEKIQEKMMSIGAQTTGIKKIISTWAKGVTFQHHMNTIEGKPSNSWQYSLARAVVMNKIKEALGLNHCISLVSGAAPISPDVKKYFMSLDLPLMEAFGMSETTGGHAVTSPYDYNFETIGKTLPGTQTKIINKDEKGHGEVVIKGRHIFMGYINEEQKTREAIDDDGWMSTGDIGYIDEKGLIYITSRLKELIITAGGENIPPVHIEHLVKNELSGISNAFLIGDKRKFLSILVSIKTEMDSNGAPLDALSAESLAWMKSLGVEYTTLSAILAAGPCPKVWKSIEDGVIRANKHSISNAQKVQKFAILPADFSVPTGELGPTLKIKRNTVVEKYHDIIENFYK